MRKRFFILFLVLIGLPERFVYAAPISASFSPFLNQIEKFVNSGDEIGLHTMGTAGVSHDFQWVKNLPNLIMKQSPWAVRQMLLPGTETMMITISRYQPCESAGDHLYYLDQTNAGPHIGKEVVETDTGGWRVRSHRLDVHFDTQNSSADISDHITIEKFGDALPAVVLRLNNIYRVSSVKKAGIPVSYTQAGGFLSIQSSTDTKTAFDIIYQAELNDTREDFVSPNEAALTTYWYPHIARLPVTAEVSMTVPDDWTAIAQGEATSRLEHGQEVTTTWKNNLPVCYLIVAAGKYSISSAYYGKIRVSVYLLSPDKQKAQQALSSAVESIRWFSENFTPFPYSRYAVVESTTFPAALECYSFTLMNRSSISIAIPHEVSHTWWGGILPNSYTHTLWNESFAEYSDGLFQRQTGQTGLKDFTANSLSSEMRSFLSKVSLDNAKDSMDPVDAIIGYGKGGQVLYTLEKMLGSDKMLRCIRQFLSMRIPGEEIGWKEFETAVENVAGKEWRAFFPPWMERTDLPELHLSGIKLQKQGSSWQVSGMILVKVVPYWLSVPLIVKSGESQLQTMVMVKGKETPFMMTIPFVPREILLDPSHTALREIPRQPAVASLLNLHIISGRLLVVYATGGSEEENRRVRFIAEKQINSIASFADIVRKADSNVTPEELASNNVFLIGKPDSLRIPAKYLANLPLKYRADGIEYAGKLYAGSGLQGLAIISHPTNPDLLLVHLAGNALGGISTLEFQNDLNPEDNLFIVRSNGIVLLTKKVLPADPDIFPLTPTF